MKLTRQLENLSNRLNYQICLISNIFEEEKYLIKFYWETKPWNRLFIQISNELDELEVRYTYDREYNSSLPLDLLDMHEEELKEFARENNKRQQLKSEEEAKKKREQEEETDRRVLAALQAKYGIINES